MPKLSQIRHRIDPGTEVRDLPSVLEDDRVHTRDMVTDTEVDAVHRQEHQSGCIGERTDIATDSAHETVVGTDVSTFHRRTEPEVIQINTTGQSDVELSVSPGAAGEVDEQLRDRLALGLVDGDGPGEDHRELCDRSDDVAGQDSCVQRRAPDLPSVPAQFNRFVVVVQLDGDGVRRRIHHGSEAAVDEQIARVIDDGHDAGTYCVVQFIRSAEGVLVGLSLVNRRRQEFRGLELIQALLVDLVHGPAI